MTVDELMEELKRQPNRRVPVTIQVAGEIIRDVDRVRWDGARVVVELR